MARTLARVSFTLLPAVDVADGQAVRLVQGEAGTETGYGDPLDAALAWQRDGAEWIHLVDLDAAFGRGSNAELLAGVVGKLDVAVELSGGIRDDASLASFPPIRSTSLQRQETSMPKTSIDDVLVVRTATETIASPNGQTA